MAVRYPFGTADYQALAATGSNTITVTNDLTVIDGKTTKATGNRTIVLAIDAAIKAGAKILLINKTNATETTTFSTGFLAPVITGVAGKTFTQSFTYDGSYFYPDGLSVQID